MLVLLGHGRANSVVGFNLNCAARLKKEILMPNLHRGEIEAEIGGVRRCLVLTLGARAELEAAFGAEDLVALAERYKVLRAEGGFELGERAKCEDEAAPHAA